MQMELALSTHEINLIKKIAKEEGFTEYELKTTPGSSKGDNYLGIITAASLWNNENRLELILKSSLDNEPIKKLFRNEMFIYRTMFPRFKQFEEEQGHLDGFSAYAKCYGTSDEDDNSEAFLVFENLKTKGYELWNRRVPMTADHVSLVLKEYGKLHAVSLAMRKKRPEDFQALHKKLNNFFRDMDPQEFSAVLKSAIWNGFSAIKGDQFATQAFERFAIVAKKFLREDIIDADEYSVILHGDCWCNNIMFKYQGPEKANPSNVCLLDWQLSWLASPALDLSYFLLTCTSKEIISDYRRFLKIYHDSLRDSLKKLQCDPDVLFPFNILLKHWQKYVKYGIYLALNLLRISLFEEHEVPDPTVPKEEKKSLAERLTTEIANSGTFNRRILDIVRLAAENDWI